MFKHILSLVLFVFYIPGSGSCQEIFETFLEPNQLVNMVSISRERITVLHVKEGDLVKEGQLLAEFDNKVTKARLDLAQAAVGFHGDLDSAQALVNQRKAKVTMLTKLKQSGNARPQELDSALTNLAMAEAQLLRAIEEQSLKVAELAVIQAQFEEKKLRSPLDGIVLKIYKEEAELVGGGDQQPILTLVQLDPLLAVFHLPLASISQLTTTEDVLLTVGEHQIKAEVDFVSPVIEAQSGTVKVRFRLPNSTGKLVSGSRVTYIPKSVQGVPQ